MKIDRLVLQNLLKNDKYVRKVIPFLKQEYFTNPVDKIFFNVINDFITKYNNAPTKEALEIILDDKKLTGSVYDDSKALLKELYTESEEIEFQWLVDSTEKFCQDIAVYNAIIESIKIHDDSDGKRDKGMIPELLSDALAVSFDNSVGHDYIDDSEDRWEYYHNKEQKVEFDLDYFNKITDGGLPKKTLNIILAAPHAGKTLTMCHMAASFKNSGKNVLYISLEMQEREIAKRIDTNLLNVTFKELQSLSKADYVRRIDKVKDKSVGKLIIKEYPPTAASTIHFKTLLNELKLKKKFIPDVIFVDYLNLCSSSRIKYGSGVNSYTFIKSIAEELRALAVEFDVPIVSATQIVRGSAKSSEPEMEDVSECIFVDEMIETIDGNSKPIKDVKLGDQITANDEYKTVMHIHHIKPKECVKITLKSGKSIIVSKEHIFPTNNGRKSVSTGLSIGDKLHSKWKE